MVDSVDYMSTFVLHKTSRLQMHRSVWFAFNEGILEIDGSATHLILRSGEEEEVVVLAAGDGWEGAWEQDVVSGRDSRLDW